jgi:hypothetical protein
MRFRFHPEVLSCLLLLVGTVVAQESPSEAKFVTVPREVGLVTVAYQPDCPTSLRKGEFPCRDLLTISTAMLKLTLDLSDGSTDLVFGVG